MCVVLFIYHVGRRSLSLEILIVDVCIYIYIYINVMGRPKQCDFVYVYIVGLISHKF